ncbi:MAG: succinylglutamate desuccinylase/aspartoacylase family protein [bacterium]
MNTQSARRSSAFLTVDLEQDGKQFGHINIPQSPNNDAWGVQQVPIAVIKNGSGPTLILTGGNHGDEYEGPVTISELARDLDPARISGRLILIPTLNNSATQAGQRVSPLDGLNLNRTFPGDPYGSITEQISFYLNDHLFPVADAYADLHSGGSSLHLLPSAIVEPALEKEHMERNIALAKAFAAPYTVVIDNLGDPRTAGAAAVRAGLTTVGTEMAGGGIVRRDALSICKRGVQNLMSHLGLVPANHQASTVVEEKILKLPGAKGFVFAPMEGVFEPFHELGQKVSAGQEAGLVHSLVNPFEPPRVMRYETDGILYGLRMIGKVVKGNCCAVIAVEFEG